MSDPLIDAEDDAATPLTPEERAALIPTYITLRTELNEVEQIGIAADILIMQLGQPRLTWGSSNLVAVDELRRNYVTALQSADREDIGPLMVFARS